MSIKQAWKHVTTFYSQGALWGILSHSLCSIADKTTHNAFHTSKMADKTMDDILSLLCSHVKLDRDKGLRDFEEKLKNTSDIIADVQKFEELQNSLTALVESTDRGWEAKHGGLMGSKTLIQNNLGSDDFCEVLRQQALRLMHDDEARVRIASGKTDFLLLWFNPLWQ